MNLIHGFLFTSGHAALVMEKKSPSYSSIWPAFSYLFLAQVVYWFRKKCSWSFFDTEMMQKDYDRS